MILKGLLGHFLLARRTFRKYFLLTQMEAAQPIVHVGPWGNPPPPLIPLEPILSHMLFNTSLVLLPQV